MKSNTYLVKCNVLSNNEDGSATITIPDSTSARREYLVAAGLIIVNPDGTLIPCKSPYADNPRVIEFEPFRPGESCHANMNGDWCLRFLAVTAKYFTTV